MLNRLSLSVLLMLCCVQGPAMAQALPHEPVPGGVAAVPIGPADSPTAPKVFYGKKRVMVVRTAEPAEWIALTGIPLAAKAGTLSVEVEGTDGKRRSVRFEVRDKQYREQRITVKNRRHVNPDPLDMERIGKESRLMKTAFRAWRDDDAPVTQLAIPVDGPFSSPFGLRRFFNDQPRKPHSGLDIAAPQGTPILAPGPGVVARTGHYFFNGKTVLLDHGHGMVTMYCHMHEIQVSEGQRVEAGEPLGTIGKTGRATGPHLHWGVSLNDVRVDPMLFLQASDDEDAVPAPAD